MSMMLTTEGKRRLQCCGVVTSCYAILEAPTKEDLLELARVKGWLISFLDGEISAHWCSIHAGGIREAVHNEVPVTAA